MAHDFDQQYWDAHWRQAHDEGRRDIGPNPHLVREIGPLAVGTALDAGCGEGAEALWLAAAGWQVTAVDIAAEPLQRAEARAAQRGLGDQVSWLAADLTRWEPSQGYDLVTTHYAHPTIPQLDFYERLATWVLPGGTLLVVGHLDDHRSHGEAHGHGEQEHDQPPVQATVDAVSIAERLDPATWEIVTAQKHTRVLGTDGHRKTLQDAVVRAVRRPA